jgi:hypothetical protein
VPLFVTPSRGQDVAGVTKLNDTAPFWGGGRISTSSGQYLHQLWTMQCRVRRSGSGRYEETPQCRALRAVHHGVRQVFDGAGDLIGTVSMQDRYRDLLAIDADTGPAIYDGDFDSNTWRMVDAGGLNVVGQYACRSSASSNQTCNIRIAAVKESVYISLPGSNDWVFPLVTGEPRRCGAYPLQHRAGRSVERECAWFDEGTGEGALELEAHLTERVDADVGNDESSRATTARRCTWWWG